MKLTEHFDIAEFESRDGAAMPGPYAMQLPWLCSRYLEPLRARFGPVTIASGFRSTQHNIDVGGAPSSFHTFRPGRSGVASDVWCKSGTPRDWYHFLDAQRPGGLGRYGTFVHVDTRRGRARW